MELTCGLTNSNSTIREAPFSACSRRYTVDIHLILVGNRCSSADPRGQTALLITAWEGGQSLKMMPRSHPARTRLQSSSSRIVCLAPPSTALLLCFLRPSGSRKALTWWAEFGVILQHHQAPPRESHGQVFTAEKWASQGSAYLAPRPHTGQDPQVCSS